MTTGLECVYTSDGLCLGAYLTFSEESLKAQAERLFQEAYEGPDDYEFVEAKRAQAQALQAQAEKLKVQISSFVPCANCLNCKK